MKRNPRATKATAMSLATGGLLGIALTASPAHALMRRNPCSSRSARRAHTGAQHNPCQATHQKTNPRGASKTSSKATSRSKNKAASSRQGRSSGM